MKDLLIHLLVDFFRLKYCTILFLFISQLVYAQTDVDSLLQKAREKSNQNQIADYIKLITYLAETEPEKGVAIGKEAITLASASNDREKEVQLISAVGHCYATLSRYDSSLAYFELALKKSYSLGKSKPVAYILNNITIVLASDGHFYPALKRYQEALDKLTSLRDSIGMASTLTNIAGLFGEMGFRQQELEYNLKALDIAEKLGNTDLLIKVLTNIGIAYFLLGDIDLAKKNFTFSLKLSQEINSAIGLAENYSNLAEIAMKLDNPNEDISLFRKSLPLSDTIWNIKLSTRIMVKLADVYIRKNDFKSALPLLNKALGIIEEYELTLSKLDALMLFSLYFEKSGNKAEAYRYLKKYAELRDTLFNSEKTRQIALAKEQYKSVQKERQIQELKNKNEIKA